MEVLIIYCHPSDNSFTARVKDEFIKGLVAAGHQYTLVDLYQENFPELFLVVLQNLLIVLVQHIGA